MFQFIFLVFSFSTFIFPPKVSWANTFRQNVAVQYGKMQSEKEIALMEYDIRNPERVEKALQFIFNVAIYKLNEQGFHNEAMQIAKEWKSMSTFYFRDSMHLLDLGDHAPLNEWLAQTYDKIENLLGKFICHLTHIDDIKAINYGFPVSIHPEGDLASQKPWGALEYQKHFVPFSTAVSYWIGTLGCSVALNIVGSLICSVGLEIPRYVYEKFLAPTLSNKIYFQYNPYPEN